MPFLTVKLGITIGTILSMSKIEEIRIGQFTQESFHISLKRK